MQVFLVDPPEFEGLIKGNAPNSAEVVRQARERFPDAFEPSEWEPVPEGQVLAGLLAAGEVADPRLLGNALLCLCRVIGTPLEVASAAQGNLGMLDEAIEILPAGAEHVGIGPVPGMVPEHLTYSDIGYVRPAEAGALINSWPEDLSSDDPDPGVYAMREEIEGWLRKARDADKAVIAFWQ